VYKLPSSSPANASWSFERTLSAWSEALTPHLNAT
jgi:double-stranded uracil-DNA glycosylase